jgi:hypothetical protein
MPFSLVLGLFIAASATIALQGFHDIFLPAALSYEALYAFWAWMAFIVNAVLSISILVFMRYFDLPVYI